MPLEQTIPVLDLGDFQDPHRRDRFVQGFGDALTEIGFLALVNSGVESSLIAQAYQQAEAFFRLPATEKCCYEYPELHGQRGFVRFGQEHAKDSPAPDLKEFWHVGRWDGADPRFPQVLNPAVVPQFLPVMQQLFGQLEACALDLLVACALYLGEPAERIQDLAIAGDTILRVIHYPPIPEDAAAASLRAAPHEDINLITLLCEATQDGLELLQRDGSWLPVRSLPGQIIVDSGDMLQWLTNGVFQSTTHRVVNPDNHRDRRFSLPFFLHPRAEADLTPLPSCIARVGHPRFGTITAGEYLAQRLREIGLNPGGKSSRPPQRLP